MVFQGAWNKQCNNNTATLLDAFKNCEKELLASLCLSVRLSARNDSAAAERIIYLFILFIQIHSINLTGRSHRYWNSPIQLYIVHQCTRHKYNSTRIVNCHEIWQDFPTMYREISRMIKI
jgi:hypothetical protein